MKAEQIIKALQIGLPRQTDNFSNVSIVASSIVFNAGLANVTTTAPHGLQDGEWVNVQGAKTEIPITITVSGNVVTATSILNHDLTEGYQENVEIIGASYAAYNGIHPLISANNRKTFQFSYEGSPGATTGSIKLLQNSSYGFNGWQKVTVTGANTFTYTNQYISSGTISGNIKIHKQIRISGASTIERIVESYTKQPEKSDWAFVVMGDTNSSKDRFILSDAQSTINLNQGFRLRLIQNFSVFVVTSTINTIGGRLAGDQMEDYRKMIFKSILGIKPPSHPFVEKPQYGITFVRDGLYGYTAAYYIHQFEFQFQYDVTELDAVEPDYNVAFRDITLDFTNSNNVVTMTTDINLDDEPIQ